LQRLVDVLIEWFSTAATSPISQLLWSDELALWNKESWDMAMFVRDLAQAPGTIVVRAGTYDNPHLPERAVKRLEERYGGTTLGRQELLA
jgi:phage terminase large subunit-like protein